MNISNLSEQIKFEKFFQLINNNAKKLGHSENFILYCKKYFEKFILKKKYKMLSNLLYTYIFMNNLKYLIIGMNKSGALIICDESLGIYDTISVTGFQLKIKSKYIKIL